MGSAEFNLGFGKTAKFGGILVLSTLFLAGCDDTGKLNLGQVLRGDAGSDTSSRAGASIKTTERDIEAPDVFSVTEDGLWDGRPSLGGVWVAHPDVKDPERVIIRNTANGKFVVGALFRRARDIPGPRLQISSDAAEALGMLAGAPASLNVTALRKEEVAVEEPESAGIDADAGFDTDIGDEIDLGAIDAPADVSETSLDPIAAASAAIDAAAPTATTAAAAIPAPAPAPVQPAPRPTNSNLDKPFIQIGIFSVEANATRTGQQMRNAGLVPLIKRGESGGKSFWRVVVGPAANKSERANLLKKIKGEGFSDAYAVTN